MGLPMISAIGLVGVLVVVVVVVVDALGACVGVLASSTALGERKNVELSVGSDIGGACCRT